MDGGDSLQRLCPIENENCGCSQGLGKAELQGSLTWGGSVPWPHQDRDLHGETVSMAKAKESHAQSEDPMNRSMTSFAIIALMSSSIAACDKPGETEQKKEIAASDQAAQARAQADHNVQAAQAQSNRDVASARADFEKSREDYRHGRQQDLADVNKKIADLEAKQPTATGKERATLDSNLPMLRSRRDAFVIDLQRLDDATPASWDGARASLDREWDALKTALAQVS